MPIAWPQLRLRQDSSGCTFFEEGGRRLLRDTEVSLGEDIAISFLTVVKNRKEQLTRTIHSVLEQRHNKIEHVIVDGRSTDGTLELIRSLSSEIEYYVSRPDRNLYEAINSGISLCRGRYICIVNSDDWITKGTVSKVLSDISTLGEKSINDPVLCYGAWKYDGAKKPKLWQPIKPTLGDYFRCSDLCHNSIFVPRSVYSLVGPYDDTFRIAADFKWIITAAERGIEFRTSAYPTCYYSMGGLSSDGFSHWLECKRIVMERFPELTAEETEGLLATFYAYKENIPKDKRTPLSDSNVSALAQKNSLNKYISDAILPKNKNIAKTSKLTLKLLKPIWRTRHENKS